MQVVVLYNEPVLPADHPDADSEHEIVFTVDNVVGHLGEAGFDVSRLGVSRDPSALLTGLRRRKPDVVFNLFEGLADQYGTEAYAAGLLEWLGVPYTGCPFQTLCIARDKPWTKRLLRGAGLPTADFFVVQEGLVEECPIEWPVIVKPGMQDASVGLDQNSVVTDLDRLNERVAYLLDTYGPSVLIEEFIRGREFNVGLIEAPDLKALPVSEIEFVDQGPGYWPIVTYDAKWKPGSRDYEATPAKYPADVSPRLAARLHKMAKQAFRLLGCRDYARVDFRIRPNGKPCILEVNPNPDFSPLAGMSGGLGSAGITHAQFTVELVHAAVARGERGFTVRAGAGYDVSEPNPPIFRGTVMVGSLPVLNQSQAKFECIYGRGCDGICCQNGRPSVYPDEVERIDANLEKFLPHLRPEARALIEEQGYLSARTKGGLPMVRVIGGWCVFFHQGCVLHKVGAEEGDKYRYKPAPCALFPLARDEHDRWYVRQWGYKGEDWDVFCLNPAASSVSAAETLREEVELARHFTEQEEQTAAMGK